MKSSRRVRLTVRVPLYGAAAFIALAALVSGTLIFEGRRTLGDTELAHLALNASSYTAAIESYIRECRGLLELTSQLLAPSLGQRPQEFVSNVEARRILKAVRTNSTVFDFLYLLRPDGRVAIIEPEELAKNLYRTNVAFQKWFQDVLRNRDTVVSDLFIAVPTNRPSVAVVQPIVDSDGTIIAVLAGSVGLRDLSRAGALAGGQEPAQYGYLTDGHGLVISHQVKLRYVVDQTDFSSEPPVQAALAGRRGAISFFDPVEKTWMLGAFLPLRPAGAQDRKPWTVSFVVPQDTAFTPLAAFNRAIAAFSALFAIGFAVFSFFLMRRFLSPLDQLTVAVQKAGAGDFSYRISNVREDEFASLSLAYNGMAAQLGEKDRTIREHQEQLSRANARLEESNKELEAFSYSVSHDLRAPLRAIDGFSHALQEDYGTRLDEQGRGYIERVRRGVQTMGALIEDMLKLSRVGRAELTREPVDLSSIAGRLIREIGASAPDRKADFAVAPRMTATADRRLLEILLGNLLDNAWKFTRTRPRARVEVGWQDGHGAPIYYVRDNGVGFDMKYSGKLFGAFQRLHSRDEYEGTGIGLVIVRRISARHGGRVWAESVLGQGSTFYFTLSGEESSPRE